MKPDKENERSMQACRSRQESLCVNASVGQDEESRYSHAVIIFGCIGCELTIFSLPMHLAIADLACVRCTIAEL